jgi:cell division protein FtsA
MLRNSDAPMSVAATLDAGTSRVRCVIWVSAPGQSRRMVGMAEVASAGIQAGEIFDAAAAAAVIQQAVLEAERSAGLAVQELLISANCGRIHTLSTRVERMLDPTIVTPHDVAQLIQASRADAERDDRVVLHAEAPRYHLDGRGCTGAPHQQFGRCLVVEMQLVTAQALPLRRLLATVEQSGRTVAGVVPSAVAMALATTTLAERNDGISVVDLGAGTTTLAVFAAGRLVATHTLAIGGAQLTQDVAAAHQTSHEEAERIKTTYATVDLAHAGDAHTSNRAISSDTSVSLQPPQTLGAEPHRLARATLNPCVVARVNTLLQLIADRIDAQPFGTQGPGRVVLTGGGSLLDGLPAYAAQMLGRRVRVGWPLPGIDGDGWLASPASAVAAGLGIAAADRSLGIRVAVGVGREEGRRRKVG